MKKKGISLIVLVITIIVIIILATAVIVTFVQNNPINQAKVAVLKSDAKTFQEELTLTLGTMKLNDRNLDVESIEAYTTKDITDNYISSFDDKYYGKLCIHGGKVKYIGGNVTAEEEQALIEVGIEKVSYITEEQATEIKKKFDENGELPSLSEEQAEKFTVFQNKLFYRYEKTTYQERLSLYAAGIPYLPGDANADGTLTSDDMDVVYDFDGSYEIPAFDNLFYICDMDNDGIIMAGDGDYINDIVSGISPIEDWLTPELQDPDRLRIVGDMMKCELIYYADSNVTTSEYTELKKYIPEITKQDAKRWAIYKGEFAYRYEALNAHEIEIMKSYKLNFLIGDVNLDGYITMEDKDLISDYNKGHNVLETETKLALADIDNDGEVTGTDTMNLKMFISAGKHLSELLTTYYTDK